MSAFNDAKFPSTRESVLGAARAFAPNMGERYARERNRVVPGHPYVSMLAPAIRVRLVLEREVAQIALDEHEKVYKCQKFVQEIHWRSYWRTWLETHPEIWTRYQTTLVEAENGLAKVQRNRIRQIENGESGVEVMDNFARELVETGYMHNHARMWFAAFWIHTEKLPWELGADFFERHLICACPASNTLSWRWVAGIQTRGKAYLARASNIRKYCDPAYLGDEIGMDELLKPKAAEVPDADLPNAIEPEFDPKIGEMSGPLGLWISEDDLAPETCDELTNAKFDAVCTTVVGAPEKSEFSNGLRRDYRLAAARDAGKRAAQAWNAESTEIEARDTDAVAAAVGDWAKTAKIKTVVALKPFVGPTDDALDAIQSRLKSEKIELILLRRPEDVAGFPYANKGFFKFWSGIKKEGALVEEDSADDES